MQIGIIVILANIFLMLKKIDKGIYLFIILSFISPNIIYSGMIMSYEFVAFFPMFFIYIVKSKFKIAVNKGTMILGGIFILTVISTMISYFRYDVNLQLVPLLGHLRYLLLFVILTKYFNKSKSRYSNIIFVLLLLNVIVVTVQLLIPQSVHFFYDLYTPSYNFGPLYYVKYIGKFHRGYGTFASPVYLSIFSLIAFSLFLANETESNKKFNIIGLIMAIYCGLTSLTKTFILGMPIIIFIDLLLRKKLSKKRDVNRKKISRFFLFLSIVVGTIIGIVFLTNYGFPIFQYMGYLIRPIEAFSTRYSFESGNMTHLLEVVLENPIIGVGVNNIKGEFIGDSGYFILLHHSGFVGMVLFLSLFTSLFWYSYVKKHKTIFYVGLSILLIGFSNTFFRLNIFLALSFICNERINKVDD